MTRVLRALAPLLAAALPAAAGAQATPARNVPYLPNGHPEQVLDLFVPSGRGFPMVVFIHGGSLVEAGERRASPPYRDVCAPFVAAAIACATIDYRLAPSFTWPAMPQDAARAARFVRDTLATLGGDVTRLFLFGHSSGCHLAAVLATDSTYLRAVGLRPQALAGVIAMGCMLNPNDTTGLGLSPDSLGIRFRRDQDNVQVYGRVDHLIASNPSRHLGSHVPPTLVVVAEAERFMPPILEQGARFVRRLLELGVPADLVVVPGKHLSSIASLAQRDDPTFAAILAFIRDPRAAGRE